MQDNIILVIGVFIGIAHCLGILTAIHAIMHTQTSQGAIAWTISLITMPYFALPLYWVFSRNKFHGYVKAFKSKNLRIKHIADNLRESLLEFSVRFEGELAVHHVLERLAELPFTRHNNIELLIDGEATFAEIFKGIDEAKSYILVQFYIINDDKIGKILSDKLILAKLRGVKVFLLYDEIGCYSLTKSYIKKLWDAGIRILPFKTTKGKSNRFQINFRNHRKIVIIDGVTAFIGGLNIGDEYLGRDKRLSPWRDTHIKIEGPAVMCVQLTFIEDWFWATDLVPKLDWTPKAARDGDTKALVLSTGPADDLANCDLFFLNSINKANQRIWIASPYFVPDPQLMSALQLAALNGVDVRIILPKKWDKKSLALAAFSFFGEAMSAGVKIYYFAPGFMHQKVMLIDHDIVSIGTANFDNRSFRWNFEISLVVADSAFASQVEEMLENDLKKCSEITQEYIDAVSLWFRFKVRVIRLFSHIL